jgi:uncharacterized protein (TIGR02391 family)
MLDWLAPEEILRTQPDHLGVAILRLLTTSRFTDGGWWGGHNFVINYLAATRNPSAYTTTVTTSSELLMNGGPVAIRLAEAWGWLDREGYIAPDSSQGPGTQFRVLTERGRQLLGSTPGDELKIIRAGALLGDGLHPRIDSQVRRDWNGGDYETAIFKAAREVEIAVRDAIGLTRGSSGVPIMNQAFGKGGTLVDPSQDPAEQEATRALYAGFVGIFKNPGSHRHWAPDDPVQAAGIIRTADLLLRMLDDRLA